MWVTAFSQETQEPSVSSVWRAGLTQPALEMVSHRLALDESSSTFRASLTSSGVTQKRLNAPINCRPSSVTGPAAKRAVIAL